MCLDQLKCIDLENSCIFKFTLFIDTFNDFNKIKLKELKYSNLVNRRSFWLE